MARLPWDAAHPPGHPLPRGGRMTLRSLGDAPDAASRLLAVAQARAGRRQALLIAGDAELSAVEVAGRVDALAADLLGAGLEPGDVVILPGVQTAGVWLGILACWRAGIIAAPLNPASRATPGGLRRIARRRIARLVIPGCPEPAVAGAPRIVAGGSDTGRTGAFFRPIGSFGPDWPALVLHSSGTTGRPKRIIHDHGTLVATARVMGEQLLARAGVRRIAGTASLGFAYGLGMLLLAPLAAGVTVALSGDRHLDDLPAWWQANGVDAVASVPTGYRRLLARKRGPVLGRFSVLFTAGEPLDEPTRRILVAPGTRLHDVLGASEMLSAFAASGPDGRNMAALAGFTLAIKRGSAVRPFAGGGPGELLVRGPTAGRMTAAVDRRRAVWRGWLRSRDLVQVQNDGGFTVLGRTDDVIVARGVNIAPQEIEAALREVPGVAAIAVVGLKDALRGAQLVGVVVPAAGGLGRGEIVARLDTTAALRLPEWKRPQGWLFLDSLPVTATGKLRRKALRELVAGRAGEILPAAS
ncbi:MAG: CoA ligase [Rhodothalassiaceae bacterium]|nr:MAG: CoA ligase [Rhodothalassiaceae bacterium]